MRLPYAEQARVDREKITEYLLSTTNPHGRDKAQFFLSFGFNVNGWQDFARALRVQGANYAVVRVVHTEHGSRYNVEGSLETPDGRNPRVRTVWQFDTGSDYPRLVTAFPIKR